MTSIHQAKLNMYRSVQQLCNDNATITKTNAAFDQSLKALAAKITNIIGAATFESQVISGITIDKTISKKNLCQNTADIAAIIFAYASNTKNNTLQQAVKYSVSDLLRIKTDLLVPTCKNIYNAANNNLTALATYGITATMLKSLQTSMDDYSAAIPKPQTAKSIKSTHTDNIKTLIKETDELLKTQLDKLIVTFKTASPNFVSAYKKARTIIDPTTSTTQIKGLVIDAKTNQPIPQATISIIGITSAETLTTKSGNFTIKPVSAGEYKITITAAGYTNYTNETLTVKQGRITKIEAGLK